MGKFFVGKSSTFLISVYLVIFIGINVLGVASYLYLNSQYTHKANQIEFEIQQKRDLFHSVQVEMGYGELIHSFKNYVLRGESDYRTNSYYQQVHENHQAIEKALKQYASLGELTPQETQWIKSIRDTVENYHQNLQMVKELKSQNFDIAYIDSKVLVDDRPALAALKDWYQYIQVTSAEALSQLQADNEATVFQLVLIIALILVVLNLLVFEFFVRRGIVKPLQHLTQAVSGIFIDDGSQSHHMQFRLPVPVEGGHETSKLGDFTNKMLNKVVHHLEEVQSVKSVVDQSSTNIMVADEDLTITYMNDSILKTLKNVEADIQKMLPHFKADNLIGQKIDVFHVNPAHQRKLLKTLNDTYVASLTLGELSLEIIVNPIYALDGTRNGFVTEWKDVTQSIKLQKMQDAVESNLKLMVERAAKGHIGEQIDVSVLDGFIHDLGEQINYMSLAIAEANHAVANVVNSMATGDLTDRVEGQYEGGLHEVKEAINLSLDNLSSTMAEVNVAVSSIAHDMRETADRNTNLSSRIQQQAASIEETAATMEEMTSTIRNNATNARQADKLTVQASQTTEQGSKVMTQTIQAMEEIRTSSEQIVQIIGLIDSIAFQTNLLALNAAVEAARAGEHGRGFAVVAGEVRALAAKSADAAKEIKGLIDHSVDKIRQGTQLAQESGDSLSEINAAIAQVTAIVGEIASSSVEQSQGVEQLNQAIASLDKNTQENAVLVEDSARSVVTIENQATQLASRMAQFKIDQEFLRDAENKLSVKSQQNFAQQSHAAESRAVAPKQVGSAKTAGSLSQVKSPAIGNVSDESWEDF